MQKKITELQAYNAMAKLFQIYYELDPSGDIGAILGSMAFLHDKKPMDGAMLKDWNKFLGTILKHKNLRDYNHLTSLEAFLAMGLFLNYFYGTIDNSWEITFLQDNVKLAAEKKSIDPALWNNWLKCVDKVSSVEDSRMYFGSSLKNK